MLMLPDFRVRQRDFLLQISRAITARLDLTEVLRRVLHASVVMLTGKTGLVALRAADNNFYVRAVSGIASEHVPHINTQLRELMHSLGSDADTDVLNEKLREMAHSLDPELRQSIALPLVFAGKPMGLLIIFRTYRASVTPDDIQVLQSFADQAAIAVHNAQLYEAINHERMHLQAILDHSADGIMILNGDLSILHFNPAQERLTGWASADAVGAHHDTVIVWERLDSPDLKAALERGWPLDPASASDPVLYVEGDLRTRDGSTISVGITYAPMLTPAGTLGSVVANVRDITNFRIAQEMQNVFISGISHELKTPVAIIKGYAATLQREDADWDQSVVRETLGVIEEEADRLTDLIQNLLTASKLQAQRELTLDISDDVALDQLAARVVERFLNQTNQHEFRVSFPDDFPLIEGDESRLRQVLDNLVSNAIKYSPAGGLIEISGAYDAQTVTITVTDQGVGLSERDRERVFDRFFRVDSKLSRRTQGTGLGLYLAKAIVNAHGGVIGVDSVPGEGSAFRFTLPQKHYHP